AWLAWWGMSGATRRQKRGVVAAGLAIAAAAFAFAWFPPYRENYILDRAGIGPFQLYDAIRGAPVLDRSAGLFWSTLAVPIAFGIAALGAGLWVAVRRVARRDADRGTVFMIVAI